MKQLAALFALFFVLSLASCKEPPPVANGDPKAVIDTSFWSLAVGNEWVYQLSGDTLQFSTKVIGTRVIEDSLVFFEIEEQTWLGKRDTFRLRYRIPDVIESYGNGERFDYITFLDSAGTWNDHRLPSRVDRRLPNHDLETPAGRFEYCTRIVVGGMEPEILSFKRGIGLIEHHGWPTYHLASYKLVPNPSGQ